MTMAWFGRRLDAPAWEDAPQVPQPVEAECLGCEEPIGADDAGVTMPYVTAQEGVEVGYYHTECFMRSVMGSMAHLEKRCSCYGGTDSEGFSREDSRRVLATLMQRGARWAQE